MKIITIKEDSELAKLLKTESNIVLDFYADWCNPCKVLSSTLSKIASDDIFKEVTVLKINVDKFPSVAQNYKVRSMPTLIFTNDNTGDRKTLKTKVGNVSQSDLEDLIRGLYEQE